MEKIIVPARKYVDGWLEVAETTGGQSIDVGHQFFSRAEMVVVGFHGHWLTGIDYIGKAASKIIVYTGQGGNILLGDRRQLQDQLMERGIRREKLDEDGSCAVILVAAAELLWCDMIQAKACARMR
ncbi:hypothetical protein U1Q18_004840 [Sarracenia purpurea var. burkii]